MSTTGSWISNLYSDTETPDNRNIRMLVFVRTVSVRSLFCWWSRCSGGSELLSAEPLPVWSAGQKTASLRATVHGARIQHSNTFQHQKWLINWLIKHILENRWEQPQRSRLPSRTASFQMFSSAKTCDVGRAVLQEDFSKSGFSDIKLLPEPKSQSGGLYTFKEHL